MTAKSLTSETQRGDVLDLVSCRYFCCTRCCRVTFSSSCLITLLKTSPDNKLTALREVREFFIQLLIDVFSTFLESFFPVKSTSKGSPALLWEIRQRKCSYRHSLMLLWFTDLMNVTEEVTIHRPNVSTRLSSAFIRGSLDTATIKRSFYMITN